MTIVSREGMRYDSPIVFGQYFDFQVKLRGNGDIEFHYGRQVGPDPLIRGSSATAWIENPLGTAALALSVNAPTIRGGTGFVFRYVP
ncbi:MAG: hypothetical protein AB1938_16750 [Myxococcota bacterium]